MISVRHQASHLSVVNTADNSDEKKKQFGVNWYNDDDEDDDDAGGDWDDCIIVVFTTATAAATTTTTTSSSVPKEREFGIPVSCAGMRNATR